MQVYARPKIFLLGSSLVFNLKEGPVRCGKVCNKSWVILFFLGDPNDPDVFMGALNSKVHLEKVEKYGHLAKEEGGTIHCGFGVTKLDVGEDFKNGYYFPPTIVTGLTNKSR